MIPCPSLERWESLLEGQLSEAEMTDLSQHLQDCPVCQETLERLSTDPNSKRWRQLREADASLAIEPQVGFLRRLKQALAQATTEALPPVPLADDRGRLSEGAPEGFEILEVLGRGGVGVVYKARQVRLKRTVALKMLLTGDYADEAAQARFQVEAEVVARLQHPNIVPIYEVGQYHGCPYLVLEFVAGPSLAQVLPGTPQQPQEAANLIETLARAMHYAHQQGVVHRDIKPANILLQTEGRKPSGEDVALTGRLAPFRLPSSALELSAPVVPKITDFGLAKRLDEVSLTQTGAVLGTPCYMAPEQARGRNKEVDAAADIYALGALLYEMLTGRPPFRGLTSVDTIMQLLHEEPVSPRSLLPRLHRDLETICLKCLEKNPHKRYPSALALAEELHRFRLGKPIQARPLGVLGQGWRWCQRQPALAGTLTALLLTLVAGLVTVFCTYLGAEQAWQHEKQARLREAQQREQAERGLYHSRIALAQREWLANDVSRSEHLLDLCLPEEGRPDYRGWEWHYLKRLCHADLVTRSAHGLPIYSLAYSRDGTYLVSAGGDPGYHTNPRDTPGEAALWGAERLDKIGPLTGHTGGVLGAAFGLEGAQVVTISADNTVRLWDRANQRQQSVFPCDVALSWRGPAALSPDGRTVAVVVDREVHLRDLATGETHGVLAGHTARVNYAAFSPDGSRLATNEYQGPVRVWDLRARRELYRVTGGWPGTVAFAPNGKVLATPNEDCIKLWDAADGREVLTLRGHASHVRSLAWGPDSRLLASAAADQTVRVWDAQTGLERSLFRGHTASVTSVAFHPDGRRIASGDLDGVIKVWDVTRDQRVEVVTETSDMAALAFSADGQSVLVAWTPNTGGGLRGWDVTTGRLTLNHPVPVAQRKEWPLNYVALSADGLLYAAPAREDPSLLRVWDVRTGQEVTALHGHRGRIRVVSFSSDGQRLASASGTGVPDSPHELLVWQLPAPRQTAPKPLTLACSAQVQCLAFSADGRRLAVGETAAPQSDGKTKKDGGLGVWDVTTGTLLRHWIAHPGTVQSVVFDPGGEHLASAGRGSDQSVRLWDVATSRNLHVLSGPTMVTSVKFSPDGRRLAAVGYDSTVHLWDSASGVELLTLRGPGLQRPEQRASDCQVVFSPDGSRLAVNAWTNSVLIWDARPLDAARSALMDGPSR